MSAPELITVAEASSMLRLAPQTIRAGKGGTRDLTHVPMGRRVLLVRSEVEQLIAARIAENIPAHVRALETFYRRRRA